MGGERPGSARIRRKTGLSPAVHRINGGIGPARQGLFPQPARSSMFLRISKAKMGLFIRTIGIKRAEAKITLANLAFNMHSLVFHETRAAAG
ncbi:hypothetical protein NUTIK01_27310 [Novosphingobium sp. IK01]|uniref:Transposase DDE domain-containing protein n=1 Tax=Novosphingobium pituita TaxID=3056842 RepID=A0ABQ6PBF8_9SPHN|nr:hypothetical protein NUTIK01_27310 [Novosphingobium sp. IK01]